MFLREIYKNLGDGQEVFTTKQNTLGFVYSYWRETLFERCIRLFKWNCPEVPQKEIEQNLIINGLAGGLRNNKGKIVVTRCTPYQQNVYYDEWKYLTYSLPYESGKREIGKDAVLFSNTQIRNPLLPLIHHYALLLAHTDVSIQCEVVNLRTTTVAKAKSKPVAKSIETWQEKIYNGEQYTILDDFLDSVTIEKDTHANTNLINLTELRRQLVSNFYEDIGIQSNYEKKERMVVEEAKMNKGVLLVNINDMFEMRQKACEEMNALFGTNWSVKKSIEYEEIEKGENDNEN